MTSSVASAKEDEVTSSEEAKAFSENENNAEVKGQSLLPNINPVRQCYARRCRRRKGKFYP
jgi:hypothetical protein